MNRDTSVLFRYRIYLYTFSALNMKVNTIKACLHFKYTKFQPVWFYLYLYVSISWSELVIKLGRFVSIAMKRMIKDNGPHQHGRSKKVLPLWILSLKVNSYLEWQIHCSLTKKWLFVSKGHCLLKDFDSCRVPMDEVRVMTLRIKGGIESVGQRICHYSRI